VKISSVEAIPLAASFKQVFRFGTTDRSTSPNVIVRIATDGGVVGYGEACPVQAFTSET
jgi:L-alanine-DL-glutamate epimerase-like enolase superfamily enzyme